LLVAAASHPFADWRKQPVVRDPHYQWVLREHGYLLQRLLSFGLHVHVGMRSAEAALYAMAEFRRWLYPLLALSANSPFYEGHRSGLASTRAHLFGSMPRTGLPPAFTTFAELEDFYEKLLAAGDLKKPGDLWWSIRPQPPLGTIEVRSYDLPTDVGRLAVLAAITQAAMATYQDRYFDGTRRSDLKREYLEQNRWKAMRYGLDANILEPETGEVLSVKGQLHRLLDFIAPKTEEIRSSTYLDRARDMISEGSEADRQVRTWESMDRDLRRLELDIALRTI
jgi:carboxylate-amine ligase